MFKKSLKLLLPVFLAALLAFTVTGCGSSGGGAAASLDGTYTAGVDMTKSLSESSGLDIQTELVMHFILTLSSGKNYSLELDSEKFVADTKAYYESEMPSLLRQSLLNEGLSEEQIDEAIKKQGFETFEEFAAAQLANVLASLEEQYADGNSVLSKGTYTADGEKISLKDEDRDNQTIAQGTIESDGSLSLVLPVNGEDTTIVFKK